MSTVFMNYMFGGTRRVDGFLFLEDLIRANRAWISIINEIAICLKHFLISEISAL